MLLSNHGMFNSIMENIRKEALKAIFKMIVDKATERQETVTLCMRQVYDIIEMKYNYLRRKAWN